MIQRTTFEPLGGHRMPDHLIKSTLFFQDLLCSYFQCLKRQVIETLLLLCVCHLFGLYNPNQVADALELPKAGSLSAPRFSESVSLKVFESTTWMCDGSRFHQRR